MKRSSTDHRSEFTRTKSRRTSSRAGGTAEQLAVPRIGIDLGTTYTGVAVRDGTDGTPSTVSELERIKTITNYPNDLSDSQDKQEVPSVVWFKTPSFEIAGAQEPYMWGFGPHRELKHGDLTEDNRLVRAFKLELLDDRSMRTWRSELRPKLAFLRAVGAITKPEDVASKFLTHVLLHVKNELGRLGILNNNTEIEFAFGVPVACKNSALRRMQKVALEAIENAGLRQRSLFFVEEPEAATAFVLAKTGDFEEGETVIVMDAGGGTVDVITYAIGSSGRVRKEVVAPQKELCGSEFLNENARAIIQERLQGLNYLEQNGITIDGCIEDCIVQFETQKRRVDITDANCPGMTLRINYLIADEVKNFRANRLVLSREDLWEIFKPCLNSAWKLLASQIDNALSQGLEVTKVILVGGFGACPSLYSLLRTRLSKRGIALVQPKESETAVAQGAVLRALNRDDNLERIARFSCGFMRRVRCDQWQDFPDSARALAVTNEFDGRDYVYTLYWCILKDEPVKSSDKFVIPCIHAFPENQKQWNVREELYITDGRAHADMITNYPDPEGLELMGYVEADLTTTFRGNPKSKLVRLPRRKPHYEVQFDLVVQIIGLNFTFSIVWDASKHAKDKQPLGESTVTLAAAFSPSESDVGRTDL